MKNKPEDILGTLRNYINDATANVAEYYKDLSNISIEIPENSEHGEISTNAAMVIASGAKINPRELANKICEYLRELEDIRSAEIAGPGFVNIVLEKKCWHRFLKSVALAGKNFGDSDIGKGKSINVEFVSANPTGPLHIGHVRGAVFGDVLSNLLSKCGYEVTREFYVNDAGKQIETLSSSLFIRYQNLFGNDEKIPEGGYPGEYLIEIAKELKDEYGDKLLSMNEEGRFKILSEFAVSSVLQIIKRDLKELGVSHDSFVHEKSDIVQNNKVGLALKKLSEKNLTYRGVLEAPKSLDIDDWEAKEQLIFKSTEFGDDVDRALVRSDGSNTYFSADVAYHMHKIERGFSDMALVLGADHTGYVKRIKSVVSALSDKKIDLKVFVAQLVNLFRDGKSIKMSKRSGEFVTLKEMLDEIGKDALRFSMLLKKNDTTLDFDCEKVKEQSKDNPVFYVQYAHARAHSIFRKAAQGNIADANIEDVDFSVLQEEDDISLIKQISLFPSVLQRATLRGELHKITYYLYDLANLFHQIWAKGNQNSNLRFIYPDNQKLTQAKLALVMVIANTIASGLDILGIDPVTEM